MSEDLNKIIFQVSCPDQPGIIARISGLIFTFQGNIIKLEQHVEELNLFFMRLEVEMPVIKQDIKNFYTELKALEHELEAHISWQDNAHVPRVAVLVSKESHCLIDLFTKQESGELRCSIPLVISNQPDLESLCQRYDVPFHYLPITVGQEAKQERAIVQILNDASIDLIVLAKYMRILSEEFVSKYPERIINIHHSFLPAFKGARPYFQAWERGVKIIGASAHYATANLDEGPILAQDIKPVSHTNSAKDMVRIGRDIERRVLNEAVSAWLDYQIIVHNKRSIVFS